MQMNLVGAAQIRQAIHGARHEVLLTVGGSESTLDQQIDVCAVQDVADTGDVSARVYVSSAARDKSGLKQQKLAMLARRGITIDVAPGDAPRMAIIDRSVVVLARNKADYSEGALIGRGLPFTSMLVNTLITPPVEKTSELPEEGEELDAIQREVLRQLVLGATDERACRELGVALRTYRRLVARLMNELEAESRFQAGYLAAKRNWI